MTCAYCNKPGAESPADADGDRYHWECIDLIFDGSPLLTGWRKKDR